LSEVVRFLGVVSADKMPGLYQGHDILVSATAQEGMSNAMLEGMACGMPIVTTRCEGVEELIGANGVIVEEPRAAGLAAAVRGLLEDGELYDEMAKAARRRAEKFTWGGVAEEYIKRYEQIAERGKLV
ncbi:MAG: glycosyltransferase family 4 protein, partial [Planctomycetes bacterium]|nr:glycosyltransferase family 4 protein [Planctomycetota bacterium]